MIKAIKGGGMSSKDENHVGCICHHKGLYLSSQCFSYRSLSIKNLIMKSSKKILVLLIFGYFIFSSCRTGEVLSEADPETEAEVKKSELPEEDLQKHFWNSLIELIEKFCGIHGARITGLINSAFRFLKRVIQLKNFFYLKKKNYGKNTHGWKF